jgi:Raf kinase inhibitor-like YbhB/YbcL family protein
MELQIGAFAHQSPIPARFTADGADLSPALAWTGDPSGAAGFALIVDDPDAPVGLWVHWVAYDLPGQSRELKEGQPKTPELPGGGRQGKNSWGRLGYNGPAPPPGKPHRYFFKLFALSASTGLLPGATRSELERAMSGKVLGEAQWMGTYRR